MPTMAAPTSAAATPPQSYTALPTYATMLPTTELGGGLPMYQQLSQPAGSMQASESVFETTTPAAAVQSMKLAGSASPFVTQQPQQFVMAAPSSSVMPTMQQTVITPGMPTRPSMIMSRPITTMTTQQQMR